MNNLVSTAKQEWCLILMDVMTDPGWLMQSNHKAVVWMYSAWRFSWLSINLIQFSLLNSLMPYMVKV